MASDRQQFHTALRKWDQLQADAQFSVPDDRGELAILLPYNHAKHAATEKVETFDYFARQTLRLADHIVKKHGRTPKVALDATEVDFKEMSTDPHISSVIVIGKGTLSSIEAPTPSGLITWKQLSEGADHLKTGSFHHIACGGVRKNLNVPLGTFLMADHRLVHAAVHTYLPARVRPVKALNKLSPISTQQRMDLTYVKEHFPFANYYSRTDELLAFADRIEKHARSGTLGEAMKRRMGKLLTSQQPVAETQAIE